MDKPRVRLYNEPLKMHAQLNDYANDYSWVKYVRPYMGLDETTKKYYESAIRCIEFYLPKVKAVN